MLFTFIKFSYKMASTMSYVICSMHSFQYLYAEVTGHRASIKIACSLVLMFYRFLKFYHLRYMINGTLQQCVAPVCYVSRLRLVRHGNTKTTRTIRPLTWTQCYNIPYGSHDCKRCTNYILN